jgi:5-methylcytosine-specific restriction endonuclease McrA
MPHRPCTEPRCPNFARPGKSKCDEHQRAYERERSRRRREATKGVYKKNRYLMARRKVLLEPCQCSGCASCAKALDQKCVRLSAEADHIVPLSEGGDSFALSNLRGLCKPCHIERHRPRPQTRCEAA